MNRFLGETQETGMEEPPRLLSNSGFQTFCVS